MRRHAAAERKQIMENNNTFMQALAKLQINDTPRQAIHIDWDDLSGIYSELLSAILGREIIAESDREEYYYWLIRLLDNPLEQGELETIFVSADAGELDREQNDFGDYPILELCQGLCDKLMDKLLPYRIDHVKADYEGVWFIGTDVDEA